MFPNSIFWKTSDEKQEKVICGGGMFAGNCKKKRYLEGPRPEVGRIVFSRPEKNVKTIAIGEKPEMEKNDVFSKLSIFFQCFTFSAFPKNVHVFFLFWGGRGELSIFSTFCWMGFFHDFFQYFGLIGPERKECTCYILA